jgi:hypothetical protein
MANVAQAFDEAMFSVYRLAKDEAGYNATIFLSMLHEHGGLATAKALTKVKAGSLRARPLGPYRRSRRCREYGLA